MQELCPKRSWPSRLHDRISQIRSSCSLSLGRIRRQKQKRKRFILISRFRRPFEVMRNGRFPPTTGPPTQCSAILSWKSSVAEHLSARDTAGKENGTWRKHYSTSSCFDWQACGNGLTCCC